MKVVKSTLFIMCIFFSMQASAWVASGEFTIKELGIYSGQVSMILTSTDGNPQKACYLKDNNARFKEMVSLLLTLYASGKSGYFRCSETERDFSPWRTDVKVYELLDLTAYN